MRRLAFLYLALIAGCASSDPEASAEQSAQAHKAANPTRQKDPNPLDWVRTSYDEFDHLAAPRLNKPEFLSPTDPVTQMAQFWADELYNRLSSQYPTRIADDRIPRPLVRIWVKKQPNGFVSPISTCYKVPVRLEAPVANADETSDQILGLSFRGLVFPVKTTACAGRADTPVDPALVAEQLNRNIGSCKVYAQNGELVVGRDCKLTPKIKSKTAAGFALTATSNIVVITTGMVELAEREPEFVAVLVHELGHYFKSHAAMWTKPYNFFYRQQHWHKNERPVPDPSLKELGDQLVSVTRRAKAYPVAGQSYHSGLFPVLTRSGADATMDVCKDQSCAAACRGLWDLQPAIAAKFGKFPTLPLADAVQRESYAHWEQAVGACFGEIPVAKDGATANGQIGAADIIALFPHTTPENLQAASSLLDLVRNESARLTQEDSTVNALLQKALDEKLGYYTFEQEADDLAAEWLPKLGISPKALIDKLLTVMKLYQHLEYNTQYDFGYERCSSLYRRFWFDHSLQRVQVPLGDFANPHHGRCYRIYNVTQEFWSHWEVAFPWNRPARQGETWAELRQAIIGLHSTKFPNEVPVEEPLDPDGGGFVE